MTAYISAIITVDSLAGDPRPAKLSVLSPTVFASREAEFDASAIDPEIADLNFGGIEAEEALHFLYPNGVERRNDGRLTDKYLKIFRWLMEGGWYCQGINPLTMERSSWGCLKSDRPRRYLEKKKKKKKLIKYEHPREVATEIFCLRVNYRIGLKIAKNQGIRAESEYLDRMVDVDLADEDEGFWLWVLDTKYLRITLTEGPKKAASQLSAGHLAIGLPGISNGFRSQIGGEKCKPFLIPHLKLFAVKDREFTFCFDQDTKPKTIANVNKAISSTGRLLEREGCKVSVVGGWTASCKGVDDLIYSCGEDAYHEAFNNRKSLDAWRLDKDFGISKYPQIKVNVRYLDPSVQPKDSEGNINLQGKIIAIKSAKNTGKTEYIANIVQPDLERGRSVLIITHRIQLAMALARRVGINHISEVRDDETGKLFGYSLCIDSLHPDSQAQFNPDDWDNSTVVIDECEQVLWHLLNSTTCQGQRVAILRTFTKLLQNIAHSNGTIIMSDADLSGVSIDYIQNLTDKRLQLWLLNNSYNPNQGKRKLYLYHSPALLVAAVCQAIEKGEKVLIHCSSQQANSKWAAQHLESLFGNKFPDRSRLLVDSQTVREPRHPACGCIDKLNEILQFYDIVIASPTIETGVSIDIKHFDSVWCLANGVQTVDAVCQTLERVRDDVPRHLCITIGGIKKVGNGSDSTQGLLASQHKMFKANFQFLAVADGFANFDGFESQHLSTWAKYAAKANSGFINYERDILDKLHREGYDIATDSDTTSVELLAQEQKVQAEILVVKDLNYTADRQGKIAAKNPDDERLKELKQKAGKTKAECHQESKGNLCRRYLTEDITHDLIIKDDDDWHPQLQLHYYLTLGRKYLKSRDIAKIKGLSPDNGMNVFQPDANRTLLSTKILALEALDIQQFFGEDKTFTSNSLVDWFTKITECRSDIKRFLGVWIGSQCTPIGAAQQLLGKLGLKLEYIDRIRIDGKSTRRYSGVDCNADERQDVLVRWLERDNRIAEMAERSTQPL